MLLLFLYVSILDSIYLIVVSIYFELYLDNEEEAEELKKKMS